MIQLPIDSYIPEILDNLLKRKNLILTASPGSGKTTRVPAALLKNNFGRIIVLVPKRIAAVSAADRIATENNWHLGKEVGYHVRFEPVFETNTKLIFMTEGVFIKKSQNAQFWSEIDILICDEFHERSALLDLALGLAVEKQILENHPKIIVMSATLNTKPLENYLPEPAVLEINAPPFPLTVHYSTKPQRLICDIEFYNRLTLVVGEALNTAFKDILVFLPGLSEMRKAQIQIQKKWPDLVIEILHGSNLLAEQKRILQPQVRRRIILSTDIAESSLTLPSVDAVIDSGLKKMSTLEPKIGFSQLGLYRISIFSAQQRAGRAARTGPGVCYKLWHESDELSMPFEIKPEILKSSLLSEILTLKSCGVDNIANFMWLNSPFVKNIEVALEKLKLWKLLSTDGSLTSLGLSIQQQPLDLENGILFYHLAARGYQKEAAHLMACLETLDFTKIFGEKSSTSEEDLEYVLSQPLPNAQAHKIRKQLESFSTFQTVKNADFKKSLISIFFEFFPYRIAKLKSQNDGISSLGRGLSFLPGLQARHSEYCVLLAGYNSVESKTDIHFATGFAKTDFLEFSSDKILLQKKYSLDLDKMQISEVQIKSVGQFVITQSAKTILNSEQQNRVWPEIFSDNSESLLAFHPDYKKYVSKLLFLKKKAAGLELNPELFDFFSELESSLNETLTTAVHSLDDFLDYPLFDLLLTHTPQEIGKLLMSLPDSLYLPAGKAALIYYDSENAPMISVKIQDILGWSYHPHLLGNRLPLTLELLAPNKRPTQITQNLKLFWEKSYFEIRKELKPRYPKHPWPDLPAEYKHSPKVRI